MKDNGKMTMAEAGRKGGMTTKQRHGHEYYVGIGKKGGAKVRELIDLARQKEATEA